MLEDVGAVEIDGGKQLLVGVAVALRQILQEFGFDEVARGIHISRIAGEIAGTHTTTAKLEIFGSIADQGFGDIVDVARGEFVAPDGEGFVQSNQVLESHPFNTEINPREMRAPERIAFDGFFQHRVAGHTEQIITRGVAVVEMVGFFTTVGDDFVAVIGEGFG